jgi:hypothetical protein
MTVGDTRGHTDIFDFMKTMLWFGVHLLLAVCAVITVTDINHNRRNQYYLANYANIKWIMHAHTYTYTQYDDFTFIEIKLAVKTIMNNYSYP